MIKEKERRNKNGREVKEIKGKKFLCAWSNHGGVEMKGITPLGEREIQDEWGRETPLAAFSAKIKLRGKREHSKFHSSIFSLL